jgi:hypothetical protein
MSWDSKSARRRQNSNASRGRASSSLTGQQAKQVIEPKSSHVTDPFLQDFLGPSFSAADYLNTSLPPLQQPGLAASRSSHQPVPLADLSTQSQTLLSQLNAHTTRLSDTLTQLTDDILRSGSRLAYEVELLRGETLSLSETLNEKLADEIKLFLPNGIQEPEIELTPGMEEKGGDRKLSISAVSNLSKDELEEGGQPVADENTNPEPAYIGQLRTLTLVRSRFDSVIKTFGEAMEFVFPPSEVSVSSSFLSVSAPEPGPEQHSTEEKGQQVLQKLREEIAGLLAEPDDTIKGIEKAAQRIEELKELNKVWKGTAEEKGRTKFIESLAKMVEDRHKTLLKELEQTSRREGRSDLDPRGGKAVGTPDSATEGKAYSGGYGIMSQLHKIRGL